jgi:asparagine N-glycosylation enzyme membrane subunit Stt3
VVSGVSLVGGAVRRYIFGLAVLAGLMFLVMMGHWVGKSLL